jgi:maltokinase
MAPAAAAAIGSLADVGVTAAIPLHGDLHVGQILRWDGGLAVSDFDGDPIAPAAWRSLPGAPTRDVAAMARAIDHVGRIVTRRRPGRAPDVSRWAARARAAFLDAYRVGLGANASVLFDERLLHPFEVVQECHEYVYAARYLPSWGYVPDAAMPELLGAGP